MAASIKCDERPFKGRESWERKALPPQQKPGRSGGQRPPAKIRVEIDFFGIFLKKIRNKSISPLILAGGCCPPDPPIFGWGGKAPQTTPLKRSFVTFDRGGQTGPPRSNDFFFGAADDTRAAWTSGRTSGRTPGRTPADDTGAADDRPPTRSTTSRHRRKLRTPRQIKERQYALALVKDMRW